MEKQRNKDINTKPKKMRKGASGTDFDYYAKGILSLHDHDKINTMLK